MECRRKIKKRKKEEKNNKKINEKFISLLRGGGIGKNNGRDF